MHRQDNVTKQPVCNAAMPHTTIRQKTNTLTLSVSVNQHSPLIDVCDELFYKQHINNSNNNHNAGMHAAVDNLVKYLKQQG